MKNENKETIVIVNNQSNALGIASLIFGFISIFIFSIIFVPLALILGILGIIKKQIILSVLGIVFALIGFATSPMLLGIFGLATIATTGGK